MSRNEGQKRSGVKLSLHGLMRGASSFAFFKASGGAPPTGRWVPSLLIYLVDNMMPRPHGCMFPPHHLVVLIYYDAAMTDSACSTRQYRLGIDMSIMSKPGAACVAPRVRSSPSRLYSLVWFNSSTSPCILRCMEAGPRNLSRTQTPPPPRPLRPNAPATIANQGRAPGSWPSGSPGASVGQARHTYVFPILKYVNLRSFYSEATTSQAVDEENNTPRIILRRLEHL